MAKAFKCDLSAGYMDTAKNGINITGRDVTIPEGTVKADIRVVFKLQDGTTIGDFTQQINNKLLRQLLQDLTP
jgi:hypothetical protein